MMMILMYLHVFLTVSTSIFKVLDNKVGSTITITLEDCTPYEYLLNDGTQCRTCDACPAGQRYTIHCGYQQDKNGNISKPKPSCEPCPQGTYKGDKSLSLCRDCKLECPGNRSVVRQCNGTHDLKCGRCKKGFYTEYDGTCMPCLPCRGNVFDLVFQEMFVLKECKDAGMGTKSCRPHMVAKPPRKRNCKKGCRRRRQKGKYIRCLSKYLIKRTTRDKQKGSLLIKAITLRQLRRLLSKRQRNILILLVESRQN